MLVFAIGTCGTSSPPIRVYEPAELRMTLQVAAQEFLEARLLIKNSEIIIPAPLQWYYEGFCEIPHDLPQSLREYMLPAQKAAVKQALDEDGCSVSFEEFDWNFSLNVQGF